MAEQTPPEQPDPSVEIANQLAALRQEIARVPQVAAQVAARVAQPQQAAPTPPKPTMGDYEAMRERMHAELRENPVRLFGEVTQTAKAQAVNEAVEIMRQENAYRDAMARGEAFERALFEHNRDVQTRWADVRQFMTWAQQNRPDLTPEQQAAMAIESTRQRVQQERDLWAQQQEEERRQTAFAGSPRGGAYPPGGPAQTGHDNRSYDEQLRERMQAVSEPWKRARAAGAYKRTAAA